MIDWKRKLTSSKFWMAIVAVITPLMLAFGVAESDAAQVTAIIMAGADVVAYIIAEKHRKTTQIVKSGWFSLAE